MTFKNWIHPAYLFGRQVFLILFLLIGIGKSYGLEVGEVRLRNSTPKVSDITDADIKLVRGKSGSSFRRAEKILREKGILEEFKKLNPELTNEEITAVYRYTVDSDPINNPLRGIAPKGGGTPLPKDIEKAAAFEKVLNSGLEKLRKTHPFQGPVFKGGSMKESDVLKYFQEGKKYSDPAFMSASKEQKVADHFMNKVRFTEGNVKVKFFINTKEGAYINDLSHFSERFKDVNPKYTFDQQEILFGSKTEFEVFDMEKVIDAKGETVYEIYMNQL